MSETNVKAVGHTPGPWSQHDSVAPYGESYAATVWGPRGPGYGLVADCRTGAATREEEIANARLIAAAPALERRVAELEAQRDALLEALRALVVAVRGGEATSGFIMDDALLDADEAIAEVRVGAWRSDYPGGLSAN